MSNRRKLDLDRLARATPRPPATPPAIAAALHTAGTYQMAGMSLTGSLALAAMEHSDEIAAWMNSDDEGRQR